MDKNEVMIFVATTGNRCIVKQDDSVDSTLYMTGMWDTRPSKAEEEECKEWLADGMRSLNLYTATLSREQQERLRQRFANGENLNTLFTNLM